MKLTAFHVDREAFKRLREPFDRSSQLIKLHFFGQLPVGVLPVFQILPTRKRKIGRNALVPSYSFNNRLPSVSKKWLFRKRRLLFLALKLTRTGCWRHFAGWEVYQRRSVSSYIETKKYTNGIFFLLCFKFWRKLHTTKAFVLEHFLTPSVHATSIHHK